MAVKKVEYKIPEHERAEPHLCILFHVTLLVRDDRVLEIQGVEVLWMLHVNVLPDRNSRVLFLEEYPYEP